MMVLRFLAPVALVGTAMLSIGPAPAAKLPRPAPTATPLKTIKHVYSSSRMCVGLRRSIGPAVGKVLQNDKSIATSRPLLQDFVKSSALGSNGGKDIAVARLEGLIGPLVKNTQSIEQLLNDPIYNRRAQNDNDKQLLQMRDQMRQVLDQQKQALDLISGFVSTEQLGELQAAGHEYDNALNGNSTPKDPNLKPQTAPTQAPAEILNAGVNGSTVGGTNNDPTGAQKNDPRYTNTNNALGYNPLNAFDQQMLAYQSQIAQSESNATLSILRAVPVCGGHVPPPAGPSPSPAPAPLSLPTATPKP